MIRKINFAPNEWYHCYTRSIDKRPVFTTLQDYNRFLEALYLSNDVKPIERSSLYNPSHADFFELERYRPVVAIGAFSIMPNHFHILIKELVEGGVTKFMRKVGTSFAMYFNVKYEHVGNVFIKPFRSKHIRDDRYLKRVIQYIHLNAAELFEPEWKQGSIRNIQSLEKRLRAYRYSSFFDYCGEKRPENSILDPKTKTLFDDLPPFQNILEEAAMYYQDLSISRGVTSRDSR
ncbi:transposase [Patescibacteria group bacterium]|nr:transposase [Patescibacteria group bacterium]